MTKRLSRFGRATVALLTLSAWFVASDHCALAGQLSQRAATAPMHEHCPGHSVPEKKSGGDETMPCCKALAVAYTAPSKSAITYDTLTFVLQRFPEFASLFALWYSDAAIAEVDTGPPRSDSFAESVLQRSILAHAPPFLA
jgi:hypothetical protein